MLSIALEAMNNAFGGVNLHNIVQGAAAAYLLQSTAEADSSKAAASKEQLQHTCRVLQRNKNLVYSTRAARKRICKQQAGYNIE